MKKIGLFAALFAVFLVLFNLLFFLLGDNEGRNVSVWISYGFIHFSYLWFFASMFIVRSSKGQNGYDVSTIIPIWRYFILELIVGIIFIWINAENIFWPITIQSLLAAFYIIGWIIDLLANEHTSDELQKQENRKMYILKASNKLRSIKNQLGNSNQRRMIERCYDAIITSPLSVSETLNPHERKVLDKIEDIELAIGNNEMENMDSHARELMILIKDRNEYLIKQ